MISISPSFESSSDPTKILAKADFFNTFELLEDFKIKSFKEIDLLVSDIIRKPVWERSGPAFNVKDFDYIKSILKYPKNKIMFLP